MGAPKLNNIEMLYGNLIAEPLRGSVDWQRVSVVESETPSDIFRLALDQQCAHIIQTKNPYFSHDLSTAALIAKDSSAFSRTPLAAILAPGQCDEANEAQLTVFDRTFKSAGEKVQILSDLETTLQKLSIAGSLIADVVLIADELVTNAVFNAPFVDLDNSKSGPVHNRHDFQMPDDKPARVFVGIDKERLVIGCKDLFGTLNLNKLFSRIKNCYDTSVGDNINYSGSGGAGIGSYLIFNSSASYFAEVKIKAHTIICCTVPLRMSSRARSNIVKNLHFTTYR